MVLDLDTFLTVVSCRGDTLYQRHGASARPKRPGPRAALHDSEVLTLMRVAQWHPSRSERKIGRYAADHWRADFPRLRSQRQCNRRVRDLPGVFAHLAPRLAEEAITALRLEAPSAGLAGGPVPVMARGRGNRQRCCATEARRGGGGRDRDGYSGMHRLLTITPCGLITGCTRGPGGTEERWGAAAVVRWRQEPRAPLPPWPTCVPSVGRTRPHDRTWDQPDLWVQPRAQVRRTAGRSGESWASQEYGGSATGARMMERQF
jgi:hypothetical protein